MKRFKLRWIALPLLGVLLVWCVASVGRFPSSPAQAPEKADIIIALGGDTGGRVRMAQSLFAEDYAPRILLTGLEDGDAQTRPAYLNWRAAYLKEHGVPIDAIIYDAQSSNSRMAAINTLRLMKREGWRRVLVVSDPPLCGGWPGHGRNRSRIAGASFV